MLLVSCGGTDGGGGGFTFSLTDPGFIGVQYVALAFSGNAFKSKAVSVTSPQPLESGNTVSVSGLSSGTEYDIFFWIDTDSDTNIWEKGAYTKIFDIGADVGFETTFYSFFNKEITITSGLDGTAHCMWLIKDTLDTVVSRDTLYTADGRESAYEMMGFVNGSVSGGNGDAFAIDYDWPLYTPGGFFVQYDLFCIIDAGITGLREPGTDYEGFVDNIDADASAQLITLNPAAP